jgi:hypothetical protein
MPQVNTMLPSVITPVPGPSTIPTSATVTQQARVRTRLTSAIESYESSTVEKNPWNFNNPQIFDLAHKVSFLSKSSQIFSPGFI